MLDNQFIHFYDNEPEDGAQPALINYGKNYITIPKLANSSGYLIYANALTGELNGMSRIESSAADYEVRILNPPVMPIGRVGDCVRLISTGSTFTSGGAFSLSGEWAENIEYPFYSFDGGASTFNTGEYHIRIIGTISATTEGGETIRDLQGYYVVKLNNAGIASGTFKNNNLNSNIIFKVKNNNSNIKVYIRAWSESFDGVITYETNNGVIELNKISFKKTSNAIKVIDAANEEVSLVEYWCDEDEFGIPFSVGHQYAILPLLIRNPQYKQSDEVYEKLNGEHVVLFSKSAKEYELVTEYLPEEWHDRIMLMLQCDHVVINGKSVYKSAEYTVDWEKYIEADNGEKLARATCKVIENVNNRNTN